MSQISMALAIRVFLGVIFFFSALGKLADRARFHQVVLDYAILPTPAANVFGFILPWLEITISLTLFAGVALHLVALMSSLLLASFTIAIIVNLSRDRILSCNCFGVLGNTAISWGTVTRNLLLITLTLLLFSTAPMISSPHDWINSWEDDLSLLISIDTGLPLTLLFVICLISLRLIEEGIGLISRTARLKSRANIQPNTRA